LLQDGRAIEMFPYYFAPFMCFIPSLAGVLEALMQAFRTGGGVPYAAYGSDTCDAIGEGNRPMFVHDYVSKWIPAMPDIQVRLEEGGHVVDIGCGRGWSSISLAGGFPNTRIDAVDMDAASIAEARLNAAQAGVTDRITFHSVAVEEATLPGPYDLVTALECIHDMPYPVQALRRMRELAAADGVVLIADEAVGDSLTPPNTGRSRPRLRSLPAGEAPVQQSYARAGVFRSPRGDWPMPTPNHVHTGQAANLLTARQSHQAEAFASRHSASHTPFTLEELIAQPLPDVSQCLICSWVRANAAPQNTRHPGSLTTLARARPPHKLALRAPIGQPVYLFRLQGHNGFGG
jgi:SAM-dependent methyltransferase